jgi:predicted DsbA family dithiol-disulfide isomerase
VHDQLFAQQRVLATTDVRELATTAGVERARLDACLAGPAAERINRDVTDAQALGIAGTPLFFMGRTTAGGTVAAVRSINGARPFEAFESALAGLVDE